MFQPRWVRRLLLAASLLCGALGNRTAYAGSVVPSQIQGEYASSSLGTQPEQYPVSFSLTSGTVTGPNPPFSSFTASNLNVSMTNPTSPVNLGTDLILNGGVLGTIDYHIVTSSTSPVLATENEITSSLTLASNTTTISLVNLNPAKVTLIFPGVDFEPSWTGFSGPVIFFIDPVPEPASIVHLIWVGVLGVLVYWRRHYRGARVGAA